MEIGVRGIIAMELNCGARKETGGELVCWRGEESMEVESGGVIEGSRGLQGEPLLGLPLGLVIGKSVQLARETKTTRWRSMTGSASRQWRRTEMSPCCEGMSPVASI
jgi:hypothetical protein